MWIVPALQNSLVKKPGLIAFAWRQAHDGTTKWGKDATRWLTERDFYPRSSDLRPKAQRFVYSSRNEDNILQNNTKKKVEVSSYVDTAE
jgi:hypothetical protein